MDAIKISQIEMFSAIINELSRQGAKQLMPRHFNAAVKAADLVVDELGRACVMATEGMGLEAWLASDDTGKSSKYMAKVMFGMPGNADLAYPLDPDDFGRCVRFIEATLPLSRPRLDAMGLPECGPVWRDLVAAWDELEGLYRQELPTGRCPKLYARMREIIKPHQTTGGAA